MTSKMNHTPSASTSVGPTGVTRISTTSTHTPYPSTTMPRFHAAYLRREDEMRSLGDAELSALNLDLVAAVVTVQGVLPHLRTLRGEMESLPGVDLAQIDALEDYALAAAKANSDFAIANTPAEELPALVDRAVRLREVLVTEARALAARGLLDATQARSFQSGVGYRAVAEDLVNVASFLREHWEPIAARTGVQRFELDEATDLTASIFAALGVRQQAPQVAAETARMRQRAFTLLLRAYDQARRAVTFLRWEQGDADAYAPSLYAGRSNGRRKADAQPTTTATPTVASVASPEPAFATSPDAVGLPNSNPFIS